MARLPTASPSRPPRDDLRGAQSSCLPEGANEDGADGAASHRVASPPPPPDDLRGAQSSSGVSLHTLMFTERHCSTNSAFALFQQGVDSGFHSACPWSRSAETGFGFSLRGFGLGRRIQPRQLSTCF